MKVKKIVINNEEIEVALKLDSNYFESNNDEINLEDTLKLNKFKVIESDKNDEQ